MTFLAISTGLAILAILGLIVGLVVLLVVIALLTAVLTPAREIARHAAEAPEVAPFLTNGVHGVDDLGRTRELCSQVPPLAIAYLEKVQSGAKPAGPPGPEAEPPTGLISGGKA